jgi:hypothetical protein
MFIKQDDVLLFVLISFCEMEMIVCWCWEQENNLVLLVLAFMRICPRAQDHQHSYNLKVRCYPVFINFLDLAMGDGKHLSINFAISPHIVAGFLRAEEVG